MPNWVYNTMTVKADYMNRILNPDNKVDFELALPMPKELDVTDGGNNRIAVYYYLSHRDSLYYQAVATDPYFVKYYDKEIHFHLQRTEHTSDVTISPEKYTDLAKELQEFLTEYLNRITDDDTRHTTEERLYAEGKVLIANIRQYGFPTWYDWRNYHWGCKWNAHTDEISFDTNKNEYCLKFSTPWSPPVGWLTDLCIQHKIPFHLEWLEEQGYRGEFNSDGIKLEDRELEPLFDEDDEDENE